MNNFIILSLIVLIPIGCFILNWILYFLGKFIWWLLVGYFPKLKPRLIEIVNSGYVDLLYFDTAIFILFLVFVIAEIIGG